MMALTQAVCMTMFQQIRIICFRALRFFNWKSPNSKKTLSRGSFIYHTKNIIEKQPITMNSRGGLASGSVLSIWLGIKVWLKKIFIPRKTSLEGVEKLPPVNLEQGIKSSQFSVQFHSIITQ